MLDLYMVALGMFAEETEAAALAVPGNGTDQGGVSARQNPPALYRSRPR